MIEFRDRSWYVPETFQMLDARHVALCLHDKLGSEIAEPFVEQAQSGRRVFAYFNNDPYGVAVQNALDRGRLT